jgi:hypothetical protein
LIAGQGTGRMHFDGSRPRVDIPAPPTVQEIAERLPVPMLTFAAQDASAWNS